MTSEVVSVYFVLGEQSGDDLAADLFPAIKDRLDASGKSLNAMGLAGEKLGALGVKTLFDIDEIAVMGISAVIGRLPKIIQRVNQTVSDIIEKKPDMILLIDSPDFTHAVAKRVRKKLPNTPIVNYICPSVWAWRSGRAAKMTAYVDHVLAILPFEPDVLKRLGGPSATYVGHPLASQIAALKPKPRKLTKKPVLLVLPGSRMSEVKRLLEPFGLAIERLAELGVDFETIIPAVPHLRDHIEEQTRGWKVVPKIVSSADNNETFANAHAALAASGTVALQLALHRVPMTLAYKLDPIARPLSFLVKTWSAALPNLIAGWPLVPEDVNDTVNPERMARMLSRLLQDTPERNGQLAGFEMVATNMQTDRRPADLCVDAIFEVLKTHEA